ncbi:PREDICTED: defensin-like protein 201, partial [Brassica oleracea var. oleracea]|uniref:defensin-like protein 201 n=1 Tax=Brassica oleracea var. oleracea TaxID=109376 RepID=UPI0006A70F33
GAREMRMNQETRTCPVFWPMVPCRAGPEMGPFKCFISMGSSLALVPCDAKKCEKMCLDFYSTPVSSYCDKPGAPNAQCACLLTDC